jgi:hypothetical protein
LEPEKLSIIQLDPDYTEQKNFLTVNKINFIDVYDQSIYDYDIAFIVSAYPNPYVSMYDSVPNTFHPVIQLFDKRSIFICHRFNRPSDFEQHPRINRDNSLSLSVLSLKNNIDFFYPIEYSITPKVFSSNIAEYCIQGHFEQNNRYDVPDFINNCNEKYKLNFLGTSIFQMIKTKFNCHSYKSNLNETKFYEQLNNCKFLLPMIDNNIKNQTYAYERFSSNFNHAAALEKPVFCHEIFKSIYEIPGIYYDDSNIKNQFEYMININDTEYENLLTEFIKFKEKYRLHNNSILSKKINNIL